VVCADAKNVIKNRNKTEKLIELWKNRLIIKNIMTKGI